jgi:hypothetical protein
VRNPWQIRVWWTQPEYEVWSIHPISGCDALFAGRDGLRFPRYEHLSAGHQEGAS